MIRASPDRIRLVLRAWRVRGFQSLCLFVGERDRKRREGIVNVLGLERTPRTSAGQQIVIVLYRNEARPVELVHAARPLVSGVT